MTTPPFATLQIELSVRETEQGARVCAALRFALRMTLTLKVQLSE